MSHKIIETFQNIANMKGLIEHIPELHKKSAILIPILCPTIDWQNNILNIYNWKIIFTIRAHHLKEHAGEVSFPGGRIDHNETPLQTALREANEEIGLINSNILSIIQINDSFARSGYFITPFCSLFLNEEHLKFNKNEVEYMFMVTIENLLKIQSWHENRNIMQINRKVWHFPIHIDGLGSYDIWGATGNILKDLLIRIKKII